jgi:ubiquinone/menaquinone biosynthesis C-methylase UbiE
MKTEWDYTGLADAYLKRPDYADAAIDAMLAIMGVKRGARVCDVGAGVAHLTLMLAARGMEVTAVEPNNAMRANGIKRTAQMPDVEWHEGTGEDTGRTPKYFDAVTFGSSFNVCDRALALLETTRILKPGGWFACMWNHRNIDDPIQSNIERIIKEHVPSYGYGTRREDQTEVIDKSGLFGPVVHLSSRVHHKQTVDDCVEAWRSHATLERQAAGVFGDVVFALERYLSGLNVKAIDIPYTTNVWVAQVK